MGRLLLFLCHVACVCGCSIQRVHRSEAGDTPAVELILPTTPVAWVLHTRQGVAFVVRRVAGLRDVATGESPVAIPRGRPSVLLYWTPLSVYSPEAHRWVAVTSQDGVVACNITITNDDDHTGLRKGPLALGALVWESFENDTLCVSRTPLFSFSSADSTLVVPVEFTYVGSEPHSMSTAIAVPPPEGGVVCVHGDRHNARCTPDETRVHIGVPRVMSAPRTPLGACPWLSTYTHGMPMFSRTSWLIQSAPVSLVTRSWSATVTRLCAHALQRLHLFDAGEARDPTDRQAPQRSILSVKYEIVGSTGGGHDGVFYASGASTTLSVGVQPNTTLVAHVDTECNAAGTPVALYADYRGIGDTRTSVSVASGWITCPMCSSILAAAGDDPCVARTTLTMGLYSVGTSLAVRVSPVYNGSCAPVRASEPTLALDLQHGFVHPAPFRASIGQPSATADRTGYVIAIAISHNETVHVGRADVDISASGAHPAHGADCHAVDDAERSWVMGAGSGTYTRLEYQPLADGVAQDIVAVFPGPVTIGYVWVASHAIGVRIECIPDALCVCSGTFSVERVGSWRYAIASALLDPSAYVGLDGGDTVPSHEWEWIAFALEALRSGKLLPTPRSVHTRTRALEQAGDDMHAWIDLTTGDVWWLWGADGVHLKCRTSADGDPETCTTEHRMDGCIKYTNASSHGAYAACSNASALTQRQEVGVGDFGDRVPDWGVFMTYGVARTVRDIVVLSQDDMRAITTPDMHMSVDSASLGRTLTLQYVRKNRTRATLSTAMRSAPSLVVEIGSPPGATLPSMCDPYVVWSVVSHASRHGIVQCAPCTSTWSIPIAEDFGVLPPYDSDSVNHGNQTSVTLLSANMDPVDQNTPEPRLVTYYDPYMRKVSRIVCYTSFSADELSPRASTCRMDGSGAADAGGTGAPWLLDTSSSKFTFMWVTVPHGFACDMSAATSGRLYSVHRVSMTFELGDKRWTVSRHIVSVRSPDGETVQMFSSPHSDDPEVTAVPWAVTLGSDRRGLLAEAAPQATYRMESDVAAIEFDVLLSSPRFSSAQGDTQWEARVYRCTLVGAHGQGTRISAQWSSRVNTTDLPTGLYTATIDVRIRSAAPGAAVDQDTEEQHTLHPTLVKTGSGVSSFAYISASTAATSSSHSVTPIAPTRRRLVWITADDPPGIELLPPAIVACVATSVLALLLRSALLR